MPGGAPSRYDKWIAFHFGRNVDDPYALDWEFQGSADEKALLVAETFNRCKTDLQGFGDQVVATGVKALMMGGLSNLGYELLGAGRVQKIALIQSLKPLYSDLLAVRSPPVLGHLNESVGSPLEYVTYMLWDVSPVDHLIGITAPKSANSLLIDVLSDVLNMKPANPAVIESVLHGFGHFVGAHPKYRNEIVAAIDYFLNNRPIVRPELRTYALAAKRGMVQ